MEKKNGFGKEYYPTGEIEYEGGFLNGKRSGKGKQYYTTGIIEYEGEYLNGIINGYGKKYDYHGNFVYEGEYLDGLIKKTINYNISNYIKKKDGIVYEYHYIIIMEI